MSISFATGCEKRITASGRELRFFDIGTGQVPVVLLHGLFGSPTNWLSIMHELGTTIRFYAPAVAHRLRPRSTAQLAFKSLSQLTQPCHGFF